MPCFVDDGKRGHFIIDGANYPMELIDLPCIIESHRSNDGVTLYKSADIAQVLCG